ncbi:MAG: hypothetical protein ACYTG7_16085 [Planctomycetota bacterium]|jgi:hypothetical protein
MNNSSIIKTTNFVLLMVIVILIPSLPAQTKYPMHPVDETLREVPLLKGDSKPKPASFDETSMEKITRISTSSFGPGEPDWKSTGRRMQCEEPESQGMEPPAMTSGPTYYLGADRRVRRPPIDNFEINQTLCTDSQGNLYAAWQDTGAYYDYIQIYISDNEGLDWWPVAYINNVGGHLREPSIVVGEGIENRLVVAYIADVGGMPTPEIAVSPLDVADFTFYSPKVWNWEEYRKPVIWTDSHDYDTWYIYLTCEGVVNSSTGNINVCAWTGKIYGTFWENDITVFGGTDSDTWIDPDGAYGTSEELGYIVVYNKTQNRIYLTITDNWGTSYDASGDICHLGYFQPSKPVDPEVAVPRDRDTAMVCFTSRSSGKDCVSMVLSENNGYLWSGPYYVGDTPLTDAFGISLCTDDQDIYYHVAYTCDNCIYYDRTRQNFTTGWNPYFTVVNDTLKASNVFYKKGIVCHPGTYSCAIAWSDFRDGPTDYATFFDSKNNPKTIFVPKEYATIQDAIDAATDYLEVEVANGTYKENIDFTGKEIEVRSKNGAMLTVIDGNQWGSVVTFANGETYKSVLRGFTLRNGNAAGGGGIRFADCTDPVVANCIITDNSAIAGGGIFTYGPTTDPRLVNLTISDNWAKAVGGALYCDNGAQPDVINCIAWGNAASTDPEISYTTGAEPYVNYCCIEGGWPTGSGNFDWDPLFLNPGQGDFHLTYDSPCINMGTYSSAPDYEDFEGDDRGSNFDVGADEFHPHLYCTGDFEPGGDIEGMIVGEPGTTPLGILFGSGILKEPFHNYWGDLYLAPPYFLLAPLGVIPPNGILVLPATITPAIPAPYNYFMQALIGIEEDAFSNLFIAEIR